MGKRNASKKKQKNSDTVKSLKGKLDITRSGMGFVIVPEQETDVLIRPSDFNTAMHGDIVKVKIKNGFGRRMQFGKRAGGLKRAGEADGAEAGGAGGEHLAAGEVGD